MTGDLCNPQEWAERPLMHDRAAVLERIPQRHEMALLHGILHHDPEQQLAIGVHEASPTDFWVRGHIPGRPLMPGVVMIEISAQLRDGEDLLAEAEGTFLHVPLEHFLATPEGRAAGEAWATRLGT